MTNLLKGILLCLISAGALAGQMRKNTKRDIFVMGVSTAEQKKFNDTYTVDDNGMIRLPQIGDVRAVGLTPTNFVRASEGLLRKVEGYELAALAIQRYEEGYDYSPSQIMVEGWVENPGQVIFEKGARLGPVLITAKIKADSWGPLEVWLLRENKAYCLRPYPSERFKKERIYPNDMIKVRRLEPWDWFKAKRYVRKVFPAGEFNR